MNKIIQEDMEMLYKRNIDWKRLWGKRVLITGAYGMLASYATFILIYLNEFYSANIEIYALGRSETKAKNRFGEYYNKTYFHFIQSDLTMPLTDIPKMDFILHAASLASSQFYGTNPVGTVIPNVIGTYELMRFAVENRPESVLFVSSGEVYGVTNSDLISEEHFGASNPLDIRYCYGEGKRMGECFCKCYAEQYDIPVKIVRLGHTYGPTMDLKNDKRVFSEFVSNIVADENIVIKSDGSPMRAFCYIADAIAGFFKVLLDGLNGEAYNIANKKGLISIRELAETLIALYPEKGLSFEYVPRKIDDEYIESEQKKHNVPDTKKLENLGWECKYGIKEGFFRTIKSFIIE